MVALASACSEVQPTGPSAGAPDQPQLFAQSSGANSFVGGLDAEFLRIAAEVPGFAGISRGEDGSLNVHMATGARTLSAQQARQALGIALEELGLGVDVRTLNLVEAEYDFIELHSLRRSVASLLGLAGVVYVDTDEAANRVALGVENAAAAANVEHALGMLGVPRAAVVVRETAPFEAQQTLRDRIRPIAGGLQIWRFIPPGQASLCSVGFNVRSPQAPNVHGFVTASHCTENMYGTGPTGTRFNQKPLVLPEEQIGTEVYDFPLFTSADNPACPVGRACRYSDAAGVQYDAGVENAFARIYRTTRQSVLPGDTVWTIDSANPMFHIVSELTGSALVGDVIHKVGRRTGWTSGPVIGTCVDANIGGTPIPNLTILCSDNVAAISGQGDSGGPAFRRLGSGADTDVELHGVLFAGTGVTYLYSPMQNIRAEAPAPPGRTWQTF